MIVNMQNLIDIIEGMDELFYQQKTSEGYSKLDQVLVLLIQLVNELQKYQFENNDFENDKLELNNILEKAMKAIELKDTVLIADIFQHELLTKLQGINKLI